MSDETTWNVCLTHLPRFAGIYRAVNDFSRALRAPILSFDDRGHTRGAFESDEARHLACGRVWPWCECHAISAGIRRQAEAITADARLLIVHSLFRAHATWARKEATKRAIDYWWVPHGGLDPWGLQQRQAVKWLWLSAYGEPFFASATAVVFATHREREKAEPTFRRLGLPRSFLDRCSIVPWPCIRPPVTGCDEARWAFRHRVGIQEHERAILFVGRLHSMKRPHELIQAFAKAGPANCRLLIVGMDGNLTAEDLRKAVPANMRHQVDILGPLGGVDLMAAYCGADAFISLSSRENFGYALADALAHGLPMIVTPGHDLVHEMPTTTAGAIVGGWLLPDDTVGSAAEAIRTFSGCPDQKLRSMGQSSKCWAEECLSFDLFADRLAVLRETRAAGV